MSECIYWLEDENTQWCDLAGNGCKCSGNDLHCLTTSKRIITALKAERQAAMRETMMREQKRRMHASIEHNTY